MIHTLGWCVASCLQTAAMRRVKASVVALSTGGMLKPEPLGELGPRVVVAALLCGTFDVAILFGVDRTLPLEVWAGRGSNAGTEGSEGHLLELAGCGV